MKVEENPVVGLSQLISSYNEIIFVFYQWGRQGP